MFSFLKSRPTDVKGIRAGIVQFIKEQLQKTEGGEGFGIKGLSVYITCSPKDMHLYEAAIFINEENKFKNEEVQKIADDYAIALPENWTLEIVFATNPPAEAVKAENVAAALLIITNKRPVKVAVVQSTKALIKVLNGEAEKGEYRIEAISGIINIGREAKTTTAEGFLRENQIAFSGKTNNESNRSVSRQHAHLQWDAGARSFFIYADEGGIPPFNKTKVKSKEGHSVKLQTTQIGYRLQQGDQVIIGESAVLEFHEA